MQYKCSDYTLIYSIINDETSYICIDGIKYPDSEFAKHGFLEIPSHIDGLEVRRINGTSFEDDINIKKVVIPDTVKEIGAFAFAHSLIEHVKLPSKLRRLSGGVFSRCPNLEHIVLPEGLEEIFRGAFESCKKLSELVIPDNVNFCEHSVVDSCISLRSIHIGDKLCQINNSSGLGAFAFNCPSLTKITVSENNKTFKVYDNVLYNVQDKIFLKAFNKSYERDIVVPKWVKDIGHCAFRDVVVDKVAFKASNLPNIDNSYTHNIKKVFCKKDSNVYDYFISKGVDVSTDLNSDINNFINSI